LLEKGTVGHELQLVESEKKLVVVLPLDFEGMED
jgi:hypothetical protein